MNSGLHTLSYPYFHSTFLSLCLVVDIQTKTERYGCSCGCCLQMVCATWALWAVVPVLVVADGARGDVLGHLTLMEAGLWAVGEVTRAQKLCLLLCICAPG